MMSKLSLGESFLIHGGLNGIGIFAVQIAKYHGVRVSKYHGVRVFVVAESQKMAEIAVKLAISKGEQLVGSIVGKLYAGISKEVSLLVTVCEEIQYIIDELGILSAFLRDAEKRQLDNEAARAWVEQVRHLSYVVEDCIEDFSLHLDHHHPGSHLSPFCLPSGSLGARHRIAIQIQSIKSRVEEVSSRRMRYGIACTASRANDDAINNAVSQHDPRLSAIFVEDSQLVGVDGPREKLVGWLLDKTEPELGLISVVGEGGIGKTTFVKKAYESPKVTGGHFKCRAWITVSQTYDVAVILRDLFKQLNVPVDLKENPDYLMGREKLTEKIRKHLEDKSYIVVFDDVWTIDAWKSLELVLPKRKLGSRILLTTRNQELAEVASATQTHHRIYRHQKLSPEQSMDLFLRRVFNNDSTSFSEELKKPTEAILEKCDGLPLAIVSIAGVLASKPNKSSREEWEKLLRRLGSELEHNPNLSGMKHILTLSYNDLPYHVRHCFLYLSKFPEDCLIERKDIQRLWVAEGFISRRPDMTAEEVAESYFNEVVNRFMILPSSFTLDNKVKLFRVHDIMLELIVQKSREENFMSIIGERSGWPSQHVIRRLSIQYTNDDLEQNTTYPSLVRSITMYRVGLMPKLISPSVGLLRVLDLEGCVALQDVHLPAISELIHLRYLNLRETNVTKLLSRLCSLNKLETLDIRRTLIFRLPKRITELQKLRHLLSIYFFKIPRGIGKLKCLQILRMDTRNSGKNVIKELQKMTQLRKLTVVYLMKEHMKDFCSSLNAISNSLCSLTVHGRRRSVSEERTNLYSLNDLSCPPLLLETLKLEEVSIKEIPRWFLSLDNLLKLEIRYCEVEEGAIESLGTLPNLIRLTFEVPPHGSLSFGDQQFLRLKDLRIYDVGNVESLSFQEGAMPHLESILLVAGYRPYKITISGITNLPSLKELRTNDESVKEALEQQIVQHPNHPTLLYPL